MGAGSPKSRIWFVMFAGVKKNVSSGNLLRNRWRNSRVNSSVCLGPGFSAMRMSPSELLIVELLPNARFTPPFGRPMLSRIKSIRSCGKIFRISASTEAKITSDCSMRVPGGGTTCRRIWPESTYGKKSRPISKVSTDEPATKSPKMINTVARWCKLHSSHPL